MELVSIKHRQKSIRNFVRRRRNVNSIRIRIGDRAPHPPFESHKGDSRFGVIQDLFGQRVITNFQGNEFRATEAAMFSLRTSHICQIDFIRFYFVSVF